MSISHLCQFCYIPEKKVHACSACHETFYCSKTCQKKDWSIHKIFCNKRDKEIEVNRRESCLKTIILHKECIFRYLLFQRCMRTFCFLIVGIETVEPQNFPLQELQLLDTLGVKFSDNFRIKLLYVVSKVVKMVSNLPECKGIPVLYLKNNILSLYVLGSKETIKEIRIIEKMPEPVLNKIASQFTS